MANIKVSELTEATVFDDGDYTMIVQANQNKKIARENILGDIEGDISTISNDISTINNNIGDLTNLKTSDTNSLVNAINSLVPVSLFDNSSGSLTVTLSDSAANYEMLYIETIGLQYQTFFKNDSIFIDSPDGKTISKTIACYNPSNNQIYIVSPIFSISGTSISISNNQAGTVGANNAYLGSNNCIGITKVIGYK